MGLGGSQGDGNGGEGGWEHTIHDYVACMFPEFYYTFSTMPLPCLACFVWQPYLEASCCHAEWETSFILSCTCSYTLHLTPYTLYLLLCRAEQGKSK